MFDLLQSGLGIEGGKATLEACRSKAAQRRLDITRPVDASADVSAGRSLFLEEVVRKLKVWAGVVVAVGVLMGGSALAYDPPRVLLRLDTQANGMYCSIGDINRDGCDDFAIWTQTDVNARGTTRIYRGSRENGLIPLWNFPNDNSNERPGPFRFIGRFLPDVPPLLQMRYAIYDTTRDPRLPYAGEFRLMGMADSTLGEEFYRYYSLYDWQTGIGYLGTPSAASTRLSRPTDFNNDGFNDMLLVRTGLEGQIRYQALEIYYGGADFDSTPDWQRILPIDHGDMRFELSSGYDVNGDHRDDMLVRHNVAAEWLYEIYLGGSPMDTTPALSWRQNHFENREMEQGFSLLKDVNGDSYDDWGLFFHEYHGGPDQSIDGFYIFFGGEELDLEPDIVMQSFPNIDTQNGELIGGDFNEDGFGDIITVTPSVNHAQTPMMWIYFGKENWQARYPEPDVRLSNALGADYSAGGYIGAVGDYNGDGADDFVAVRNGGVIVYAGWDNGDRVVEDNLKVPVANLISHIYPNPFNGELNIELQLSVAATVAVEVIDVNGRAIASLSNGVAPAGQSSFHWRSDQSGVYFVRIQSGSTQTFSKIVCIR